MEKLEKILTGHWEENKVFIYINIILSFVLITTSILTDKSIWNLEVFVYTIIPLIISTIFDHKTYGYLTSWLSFFPFTYFIWWILFNLPF
jgi:hypothetical protein